MSLWFCNAIEYLQKKGRKVFRKERKEGRYLENVITHVKLMVVMTSLQLIIHAPLQHGNLVS